MINRLDAQGDTRISFAGARLLVLVLVSAICGCNLYFDVSSVQLRGSDADTTGDARDGRDGAGPDAGDTGRVDVPPPRECTADHSTIAGCDPSDPSSCDDSETCTPRPRNDRTVCVGNKDFGVKERGESCDVSSDRRDCAAGLHCVDWSVTSDPRGVICSKLCVLDSGWGCDDGTFCTNPLSEGRLDGLGFCTDRCDPTASGACPGNADCVPDPNYPAKTCFAEFRCISMVGSPDKSEGDTCERTEVPNEGCGSGLVCAPVRADSSGDLCVQPCQKDEECLDERCVDSGPPWSFSYCDL